MQNGGLDRLETDLLIEKTLRHLLTANIPNNAETTP
jgi:hypothetical protein